MLPVHTGMIPAGWIPYPTVPFTPEAWDAFWTRYCQAAIFFRFPANDDPDVIQHGWKMHVIEKLTGAKSEDYWVDVPLKLLDSPIGGININSTLAVTKYSVKADLAMDTPGGLVTIGFTLFFSMHSTRAQGLLIFFISAMIWSNILIISEVQYPFNGIDITPPRAMLQLQQRF